MKRLIALIVLTIYAPVGLRGRENSLYERVMSSNTTGQSTNGFVQCYKAYHGRFVIWKNTQAINDTYRLINVEDESIIDQNLDQFKRIFIGMKTQERVFISQSSKEFGILFNNERMRAAMVQSPKEFGILFCKPHGSLLESERLEQFATIFYSINHNVRVILAQHSVEFLMLFQDPSAIQVIMVNPVEFGIIFAGANQEGRQAFAAHPAYLVRYY